MVLILLDQAILLALHLYCYSDPAFMQQDLSSLSFALHSKKPNLLLSDAIRPYNELKCDCGHGPLAELTALHRSLAGFNGAAS